MATEPVVANLEERLSKALLRRQTGLQMDLEASDQLRGEPLAPSLGFEFVLLDERGTRVLFTSNQIGEVRVDPLRESPFDCVAGSSQRGPRRVTDRGATAVEHVEQDRWPRRARGGLRPAGAHVHMNREATEEDEPAE